MNGNARPETLIIDNDPNIDLQIEELEKMAAPAVNAYLWFD
jgi:hypothetical protein